MKSDRTEPFSRGRAVAVVVFALCVAALVYVHRDDLLPAEAPELEEGLNPEFVKCRDERKGHVEKMLADGVIDQAKRDQFVERAVAMCASQFPPGGG